MPNVRAEMRSLLFVISSLLVFLALANTSSANCTIALAGDVMLGRNIDLLHRGKPAASVWGDTAFALKENHLTLVNHEFVLTHSSQKEPKTFNFKAAPSRVKSLVAAGIDFASLANNHSLDFGAKGLSDTIKILDQNKIAHAGAGLNNDEASAPVLLDCGSYKIGIIALTNNEPGWAVGPNKPGTYYRPILPGEATKMIQEIQSLKSKVDFVILSVHWGRNWDESPPEDFRKFAHAVIDSGIDVIHGHSGHIIQGIELYRGKPIFYSMGDLIDDYEVKASRNDLAYIARLALENKTISAIEIIPTAIKRFKASLAKGDDFDWVQQTLSRRSAPYGTQVSQNNDSLVISPK